MKELETVVPKYRINVLSIYDELFSHNKARIMEFCREFRKFSKSLSWEIRWNCQMRVDKMDEEMLDEMKQSGCYMVSYGFESYSPAILKSMKKFITPKQIHYAIHLTLQKNISIQGNFIFGDQVETLDTARETLKFWKNHREAGIVLAFIDPLPNSEIYQYCLQEGIIKDKIQLLRDVNRGKNINFTHMGRWKFCRLQLMVEKAKKYRVFGTTSHINPTSFTVNCPFCEKSNTFRNFPVSRTDYFICMVYCRHCRYRFFAVSPKYLKFRVFSDISNRLKILRGCLEDTPFGQIIDKVRKIPLLKKIVRKLRKFYRRS